MTSKPATPSRFQVWWLAARPKTLWAATAPVLVGGAMAYDTNPFHAGAFFTVLAAAMLIQVGTNFANDLFDFLHEADTSDRLGPERATQSGWVTPSRMKEATALTFALAAAAGLYLVHRGGLPILIIGLVSILLGLLYTGGPLPLGYLGLGDILVLIFFGPVAVAGTDYAVSLDFHPAVLPAGFACGMLSTAILTVNNLRDIDSDRISGKRTLAVRFGEPFARGEYLLMTAGGILLPVPFILLDPGHRGALLCLLAFPLACRPIRRVMGGLSGHALNGILAATGRILAIFGLLFSIGWIL